MSVQIVSKTWSKDSYNLFDYESKSIHLKHMTCFSSSIVVRQETNVKLYARGKKQPSVQASSLLSTVELRKGEYYVSGCESAPLWQIIRYMKQGCELSEGNVLKLGRVTLTIKKLKCTEETAETALTEECPPITGTCRVCLSEDSEAFNPLIAPCSCSGSVEAIHLQCLQRWIESRKITGSSSFHWKSIECEICKTRYPFTINSGEHTFELLSLNAPAPYMIFECVSKDSYNGIHVVSFAEKEEVTVGRGTDSDVRISDISVSRKHATFSFRDGSFFLNDNHSKFGSLVMCRQPLKVERQKTLHVQVGRTVLAYSVNRPERQKSVNLF